DMLDCHICRWKSRDHFRVMSIDPLLGKHGRHARTPLLLHRRQDTQLVIHKHVTLSRVTPLAVVKGLLLMAIDQYMRVNGTASSGMLDFERLEDDMAIRTDDGRAETSQPLQHVESGREQPICKGIIHEEGGHR